MTSMTEAQTENGVEILSKVNAVLTALSHGGQLSVAEIAGTMGAPVSSTYRLASALRSLGWLEHGTTRGKYRLGMSLVKIGGLVEGRLDIQQIFREELTPMRKETTGVWSLFVRRGLRSVCIEMVSDLVVNRFFPQVGHSLPLDFGAASLVFIAYTPLAERRAILTQLVSTSERERIPSQIRQRFTTEADDVRARGYAQDSDETAPGVASLAAPVLNRRGEVEAAVCLSGLPEGTLADGSDTSGIALVQEAGRRISRRFGHGMADEPTTEGADR